MAGFTRRRRLTIAGLMAFVAVLSLVLTLVLPLVRLGRPPCLGTAETAQWLVTRPGAAHCTQCHRALTVVNRLRAFLPVSPVAESSGPCPAASGRGTTSCISCHAQRSLP
jgi:hypothetical protein